MDIDQLAKKLAQMYRDAGEGEKVTMIHLFGIKYADELGRIPSTEIARRAELGSSTSYHTEISKARKLARYVDVKEEYRD